MNEPERSLDTRRPFSHASRHYAQLFFPLEFGSVMNCDSSLHSNEQIEASANQNLEICFRIAVELCFAQAAVCPV